MHRLFACACALAIVSVGGCKDHYKDVAELQVANFTEFAAVLRDVKDQQTMDVAEDTLIARTAHFQAASRRAKSLADPDPATLERLAPEHAQMQAAIRKVQQEAARIKMLPNGPEFLERVFAMIGGPARGLSP